MPHVDLTILRMAAWEILYEEGIPGPVAINSATYIGFRIAGFGGAAAATVGVCIPSFAIIYAISRVFDAFLSLRWVACAFRGIQACVVYLILSAGIKMLRALPRTPLNLVILCAVGAAMIGCTLAGIGCSSIVCILACGEFGKRRCENNAVEVVFRISQNRRRLVRRWLRYDLPDP